MCSLGGIRAVAYEGRKRASSFMSFMFIAPGLTHVPRMSHDEVARLLKC